MKRIGLFIGIDRYKNGINTLNCAVNDATSLMTAFARAQYDTVEALFNDDAHSEKIIEKIETITRELKEGDIFVFYFSGHGREIEGTHYLVGPTARANKAFYSIGSVSLPQLINLTNIPGLNRLFILDCCRSNMLADRAGNYICDQARDIAINTALVQNQNRSIIPPLILNSCSTGERAFEDPETNHGFFTKALLDSIENPAINTFHSFQKCLRISGTPEAQNISWSGDPLRWNEIPLFASWKGQSDDEENRSNKLLREQILFEKEKIDRFTHELQENMPREAEISLKHAQRAEEEGNLYVAIKFYAGACDLIQDKVERVGKLRESCMPVEKQFQNNEPKNSEITAAEKSENINAKKIISCYSGMMLVSWILCGGSWLFGGPVSVIFYALQIWIMIGILIEFCKIRKIRFQTFSENLLYKAILPVFSMLPVILSYYKRYFSPFDERIFLPISLGLGSIILFGALLTIITKKKKS